MSESLIGTLYAKSIDDLSGKIFLPASIASLIAELYPWLSKTLGFHPIEIYIIAIVAGFAGAGLALLMIGFVAGKLETPTSSGRVGTIIGISLMPLGFASVIPSQFSGFDTGLTPVTGAAILSWCFVLLSNNPTKENKEV